MTLKDHLSYTAQFVTLPYSLLTASKPLELLPYWRGLDPRPGIFCL